MSLFPVCFKVFDSDRDGKLSRSEVVVMLQCMKQVSRQTGTVTSNAVIIDEKDFDAEVDALMKSGATDEDRDNQNISSEFLSIEDYLV